MGFEISDIQKIFDTIYEVVNAIVSLMPNEIWSFLQIALGIIIAIVLYKLLPLT